MYLGESLGVLFYAGRHSLKSRCLHVPRCRASGEDKLDFNYTVLVSIAGVHHPGRFPRFKIQTFRLGLGCVSPSGAGWGLVLSPSHNLEVK